MSVKGEIIVAYSGVHQAYQLALAAHEAGALARFYCSLYASAGKWGGRLAHLLGAETLRNRRVEGLPPSVAQEYPWPFLWQQLRHQLGRAQPHDWEQANFQFDHWVAGRLANGNGKIFVGVETCAAESFQVAHAQGRICLLDCPQVHPKFLTEALTTAANHVGLSWQVKFDSDEMLRRKEIEFALADYLLTLSELHTRSYVENGIAPERIIEIPLWADPTMWFPATPAAPHPHEALRVLFVGGINLRKGIPYLLEAGRRCRGKIELRLVGTPAPELQEILAAHQGEYTLVPTLTKTALRAMYWDADVLVLPSIVDSFGFVAMEAMACGVPVIASENCGVPVPEATWRVPIMNSEALTQRLNYYAANRDWLARDAEVAQQFARQFTPERYRGEIKKLYERLLDEAQSAVSR
ncbi:MAG: glycosyltransferase family 4 protein [Acidobacteria bacterium]|nr:glycosyltransferase family 4 protein [Acidobacteriota bacterium]